MQSLATGDRMIQQSKFTSQRTTE